MDRVQHDLSDEQWSALKAAWGGCAYCGATDRPLQRDCVLALSRGGRYTLGNIAPACSSCNASKCNDEVTGWLRRKRFDERAFLERYLQIKASLALRFASAPNIDCLSPDTTGRPLTEPRGVEHPDTLAVSNRLPTWHQEPSLTSQP